MEFNKWLLTQTLRDDRVGDLARDAEEDTKTTTLPWNIESWREYLETEGACADAMLTLEAAWNEWEAVHGPKRSAPQPSATTVAGGPKQPRGTQEQQLLAAGWHIQKNVRPGKTRYDMVIFNPDRTQRFRTYKEAFRAMESVGVDG